MLDTPLSSLYDSTYVSGSLSLRLSSILSEVITSLWSGNRQIVNKEQISSQEDLLTVHHHCYCLSKRMNCCPSTGGGLTS